MNNLNLLPTELATNNTNAKVANNFKRIAIMGFVINIVVIAGIVSYFVINSLEVSKLSQEQSSLKSSIGSMKKTETQLFLVKDRLSKISQIYSQNTTDKGITILTGDFLPPDSNLKEAEITRTKMDFSFSAKTSMEVNSILANLATIKDFKTLKLSEFSYNPTTLFSIGVSGNF